MIRLHPLISFLLRLPLSIRSIVNRCRFRLLPVLILVSGVGLSLVLGWIASAQDSPSQPIFPTQPAPEVNQQQPLFNPQTLPDTTQPQPVATSQPATGVQAIPNPQQFRALEQADNPLSFTNAEQLRTEADQAISAQDFDQAAQLLQAAFVAYNQRSNYHQELSRIFSGIDNRISEEQRDLARDAAQLRDQSAYDLAIVYRAANRPDEAVGQLIHVISSQGPTRELGLQSYQQLLEIGFVSTPFPQ